MSGWMSGRLERSTDEAKFGNLSMYHLSSIRGDLILKRFGKSQIADGGNYGISFHHLSSCECERVSPTF